MKYYIVIGIMILLLLTVFPSYAFADNEPNDSFDEAESIGEGTFSGSVDSYALINPDTADYYKITVPAYKALLISVACGSDSTISYTLYDGNRQEVESTYIENGETSTLWFDGKNKQNYIAYLKVEDTGDYTFTVKFRPSDMKETSIELSNGQTVSDTLESAYEVHWYKINIPSGKYIQVDASSSGGGIYISIEDSQGNCLGSETGTSINLNTSEYSVTGYVYLSVESYEWSNRKITYQFTVHLKQLPSSSSPEESLPTDYVCIGSSIILLIVIIIVVVVLATRRSKKEKPPELKPPSW